MSHQDNQDPQRPERIAKIALEVRETLDKAHKHHVDKAQEIGYTQHILKEFADQVRVLPDYPGLEHTEKAVISYQDRMENYVTRIQTQNFDISAPVLSTAASTAVTSILSFPQVKHLPFILTPPVPPPWWNLDTINRYSEILEKIQPGLGKLLLGAWECLYATRTEPGRSAMTHLRELFNQFFEIIAPDEKVRNSVFFNKAEPEKKSDTQIFRKERLKCAVYERIKDENLCRMLDSQIGLVLQSYEDANKLHNRGEVPIELAKGVFVVIFSFVKQFIDSLGD